MKVYKRAVLPLGFMANAVASGIKKSGKLDLSLVYSDMPAKASCKFTTSSILAAPILVDRKHIESSKYFRAIITNSGNANCFTGKPGVGDAFKVCRALAEACAIKEEEVLASSTGIIGRKLPLPKIIKAVPELVEGLSEKGIDKVKRAILTTDVFAKEISVEFDVAGTRVRICGIAKGAGMIAPDMATMLVFIFTDANITQRALDKVLSACVKNSFNCITVDGCMSTNDSVILLSNGAAKNDAIDTARHYNSFFKALNLVCLELAKMLVWDAEGASKFIKIEVRKAKDFSEARRVALNIANSNLFKTAMFGENPNFGRIAAAAGASGVGIKEELLKIKVGPLNRKEIDVCVSLGRGRGSAVVYTSDLTPRYIKINAEYN